MKKSELVEWILTESSVFDEWHWFAYHFQFYLRSLEHKFARSIVNACLECEHEMPGFAKSFLADLFSISGKEKHYPHYEQLMQSLAELLVIRQLVGYSWKKSAQFTWEPTAGTSAKNPELLIELPEFTVGMEVKCPSLLEHASERATKSIQIPARTPLYKVLAKTGPDQSGDATLPRDNPVKDFLISANDKFDQFKREYSPFVSVLAIVWDDHIFEPISSLLSESSGLFTEKSFAIDADGKPLTFPNVDAVVLIRHLHQLVRAAGEKPLRDSPRHAMDYGRDGEFPPKAYIPNPHGEEVPDEVMKAFQAYFPSPHMGAEYIPQDVIWWTDV